MSLLDSFITKATEALDKSAADHDKRAGQAEALSDLINDPDVRDLASDLALRGTLFVGTVGARLKDIFAEDADEEPETAPEPEPTPEPEPEKRPEDITFSDIFGGQDAALGKFLDAISKAQGQGNPLTGIFPDNERPGRGASGYTF